MPILLLLLGASVVAGLVGAAKAAAQPAGGPGGPSTTPGPPLPPLQFVRTGHRYWVAFRTNMTIDDPRWFGLVPVFLQAGETPPQTPTDAAAFVLGRMLAAVGFADVILLSDVIAGRSLDPYAWKGSGTFHGQDGEPVEHLIVPGPALAAVIVWTDLQDLGIPVPMPQIARSVQGAWLYPPPAFAHAGLMV